MSEEKICVCMNCGYEWEAEYVLCCPKCACGDIAIEEEEEDEHRK